MTVTIAGQSGSVVRYTLDGSEPTATSLPYSTPFTVSAGLTVKAKAFHQDYTASATRTVQYWTSVAAPTLAPAAGAWTAGTLISGTSTTAGAKVHYTIDGREPTTADPSFTATVPLHVGDFTLKARAFLAGAEPSELVTRTYTLTEPLSLGTVAAGSTHSVAVRPDGTVLGWGYNGPSRLLGVMYCSVQGVFSSDRPIVSEVTAIKTLDVTYGATAAVRFDGQVVTWGGNDYEQLGHAPPSSTCTSPDTADRPTAREVAGLTGVVAVDGGAFHFLALKTDGTVVGWGRNTNGQLGNDSIIDSAIPVHAVGLTAVTLISGGSTHSLAVKSDGRLWAWGDNSAGQLGVTGNPHRTPVEVSGFTNPISIAAGWGTSYAVKGDGTAWVWGWIPPGLVPGVASSATPQPITALSGIKAIVTGSTATFALGADGRLWSWGTNAYGQLGDGTTTTRYTPGLVPGLPALRSVSTSAHHAVAVAEDGSIWSWGRNAYGEVGDLTAGSDRLTPIVITQDDTLTRVAIETPGTLDPSRDVVKYYHSDAIGSVRVITDKNGTVTARFDYTPFGAEWPPSVIAENRRFSAKERDEETTLDYFGGRHYSSELSRFSAVDPLLGADTGLLDPQRWNRYSYVGNRPYSVVDPDGRGWLAVAVGVGKALYQGHDVYSTVEGVVNDVATIASTNVNVGETERLWAVGDLVFELSGASDLLKLGKGALHAAEQGARSVQKLLGPATSFDSKIIKDLGRRGWTKESVQGTIDNPARVVNRRDTRRKADGTSNDDPAKLYYSHNGGYVLRNERTGEIVQVSDRNNTGWLAPSR